MTVSIVIPVFNHYDLLHQLLFDIYRKCIKVDEVIIVNDCSTDEDVVNGLSWWKETKMLPILEIRNKENRGFLLSSNSGLRRATGDVKILISTDVRIYGDIVNLILQMLKEDHYQLIGGIMYMESTGWNVFNNIVFPYVEGWLLVSSKDVWERLDYFDEQYSPNDMEDVDISTKARNMDIRLSVLPSGMAVHMGGRSIGYSPERELLTKRNQKKFEAKWIK